MSDNNTVAEKMAAEYLIDLPAFNFPASAPEWATAMFPTLFSAIYEGFNGVIKKVIADFNKTYVEMEKQITELTKLTDAAKVAMASLKEQLDEKNFIIDDQVQHISKLRGNIDRQEAYSRRDNLVFGGIPVGTKGTCTEIIHELFKKHLGIQNPSEFEFVRCHFLTKPTNQMKGSIIARFESFSQRLLIWKRRRDMAKSNYYISEDFPSEISRKRSKLRPILKEASKYQQYEKCISIRHDQLYFQGKLYSIFELHSLPTCINPRTLSERRSKGMLCFGGILSEYHEFSNFFMCKFKYKNTWFSSVEQAYQYMKAILFGDHRTACLILREQCPSTIKRLGNSVTNFDATRWNGGRIQLMKDIIYQKFSQNPELKQKLCETGTMHLAEASKLDSFYGTGVSITHPSCMQRGNWTGSNKLGEVLMDTRKQLKQVRRS